MSEILQEIKKNNLPLELRKNFKKVIHVKEKGRIAIYGVSNDNKKQRIGEKQFVESWFDEREREKAKRQEPVKAIWHAGSSDELVTITGAYDEPRNGQEFLKAENDTTTGIPKTEIEWIIEPSNETMEALKTRITVLEEENKTLHEQLSEKDAKISAFEDRLSKIELLLQAKGVDLDEIDKSETTPELINEDLKFNPEMKVSWQGEEWEVKSSPWLDKEGISKVTLFFKDPESDIAFVTYASEEELRQAQESIDKSEPEIESSDVNAGLISDADHKQETIVETPPQLQENKYENQGSRISRWDRFNDFMRGRSTHSYLMTRRPLGSKTVITEEVIEREGGDGGRRALFAGIVAVAAAGLLYGAIKGFPSEFHSHTNSDDVDVFRDNIHQLRLEEEKTQAGIDVLKAQHLTLMDSNHYSEPVSGGLHREFYRGAFGSGNFAVDLPPGAHLADNPQGGVDIIGLKNDGVIQNIDWDRQGNLSDSVRGSLNDLNLDLKQHQLRYQDISGPGKHGLVKHFVTAIRR